MRDKLNNSLNTRTDSPLSKKVSKGIMWVSVTTLLSRLLQVASAIILARLLMPSDFGAIAVCMAIVVFSQGSTDLGFQAALIQRTKICDEHLNTTWILEIGRALIMAVLLVLFAPIVGYFFKSSELTVMLRVLSLHMIFLGFRNVGIIFFRRDLDFFRQCIYEVVPVIFQIVISILLAFFWLRNAWALVAGIISSSFISFIISYVLHPYRPKFQFDIKKALELFRYGRWIFGQSIIVMITEQGIPIFIGSLLGISVLGYFNRAETFSKKIVSQLTQFIWKIGFPLYSKIQNDKDKLKDVYLKTLALITFIGFPFAGGIFIISREFTIVFLTDKWLAIVPLMQIMCVQALLVLITTPISVLFQSMGQPAITTKISIIYLGIIVIFIYPFSMAWGVSGVALACLFGSVLTFPVLLYKVLSLHSVTFYEMLKPILFSSLSMLFMILVVFLQKIYLNIPLNLFSMFLLVFSGISSYVIFSFFLDKLLKMEVFNLIKLRILAIKG